MLTAIVPMFGTVGHSMEAKDNAVLIKWQTVALSGLEMQCDGQRLNFREDPDFQLKVKKLSHLLDCG